MICDLRSALAALLIACGTLATSAGMVSPMPAGAPESPARAEVKVTPENNMPVIRCALNGVPCTMLLDTGTTHTTFDTEFVRTSLPDATISPVMLAGITNVRAAPSVFRAKSLQIGDAVFTDFDAMAIDLSSVAPSIGTKIDGVLGMNIIGRTRTIISLGSGEVRFALPREAREGFGGPAARDRRDPNSIALFAVVDSKFVPMIVDSGSSFTFIAQEANWPATSNSVSFSARDINSGGAIAPRLGERRTMLFHPLAEIEVEPLITESPLNRIGADTLIKYDMLIEPRAVAFSPAPRPEPENKEEGK